MSGDPGTPVNKPSREAEFSTALYKLDNDWKEQAAAQSSPTISRFFRWLLLFTLVAPVLYLLSFVPAAFILQAAGSPRPALLLCSYLYSPIMWLMQHRLATIPAAACWAAYAVLLWRLSRR